MNFKIVKSEIVVLTERENVDMTDFNMSVSWML
jgi:hypothetical protein